MRFSKNFIFLRQSYPIIRFMPETPFPKASRLTSSTSNRSKLASSKPTAANQLTFNNLVEASAFFELIMSSIDSADQILGHLNDLVVRSGEVATPRDLDVIQSSFDGDLVDLDQLFEAAIYAGRRIFSGELFNAKAIIRLPANVIELSVPQINRNKLGLGSSLNICETVEGLRLLHDPENSSIHLSHGLASDFRHGLTKHFNSDLDNPAPIPEGATADELADLVNRQLSNPIEGGMTGKVIDSCFGGMFDPSIHVPQLNNLTTIQRLLAKISGARSILYALRSHISDSLGKLQFAKHAEIESQETDAASAKHDAMKKMMKLSSMNILENAALNELSRSNILPGSDSMDLLR